MEPNTQAISILAACAHAMACDLYSEALSRQPGFHVTGCATSAGEVLRVLHDHPVDVVLITVSLSDGPLGGLSAVQQIRDAYPAVRCVVLFEAAEAPLLVTAFRAGAKGVLFPACDGFARLCRCVQQVHAGQIWANSAQLHELLDSVSQKTPLRVVSASGLQLLTKREEDVVQLVEEGLTNRQIAIELGLSEHTVRNNLFRIFDKLGVSTRVELALYTANNSRQLSPATELELPRIEARSSRTRSTPTGRAGPYMIGSRRAVRVDQSSIA